MSEWGVPRRLEKAELKCEGVTLDADEVRELLAFIEALEEEAGAGCGCEGCGW